MLAICADGKLIFPEVCVAGKERGRIVPWCEETEFYVSQEVVTATTNGEPHSTV